MLLKMYILARLYFRGFSLKISLFIICYFKNYVNMITTSNNKMKNKLKNQFIEMDTMAFW